MLAPVTHISPITQVRRERQLPVPGRVLVRKGQSVSATDTIAEAMIAPEHVLLDAARGLGMPNEQADGYLQVKSGAQVAQGDILAGPVGMGRRVVRSPSDGKVVLAGSGQILLELKTRLFELKAGLPGEVVSVIAERGAVIETSGALVQGVWGNGRIDTGLMYVLINDPGQELSLDQLDVSFRGSVILAGYCGSQELLKAASDLPVRGLVLSSMAAGLESEAKKLPIPILVLEGLGKRPLNSAAYKLLTTNDRREVAINAAPWDRFTGIRPELVIPLPATGGLSLPAETGIFESGKRVRVNSFPFPGQVGQLVALLGVVALPNGLRTQAAEVSLEGRGNVVLPLANLELVV